MMKRKILLIEPNYNNKYPPIGLMKLATYHKQLGCEVRFYKGISQDFLIEELALNALATIKKIEHGIEWEQRIDLIKSYIKQRRKEALNKILEDVTFNRPSITEWLKYYSSINYKKETKLYPKWDRICISTLFTFYWSKTVETINFFKDFVNDIDQIFVGGVLASLNPIEIQKATGIKPIVGLLDKKGMLDNNDIIIDELPLDYSILSETDYIYPDSNAYYGYMTRGCTRHCPFCAVPKLEPSFKKYLPLKESVSRTKELYGDKRNLLLLDNNVLASDCFADIIEEIKECGFIKGSMFIDPNHLEIVCRNIKNGVNDRAYIRDFYSLIQNLEHRVQGKTKESLNDLIRKYKLTDINTIKKDNILNSYDEINAIYIKTRNLKPKPRKVDFNQGVDARYINEDNIRLLAQIPINPLRIAFDDLKYQDVYVNAIRLAANHGIRKLSNYLLYNFKDTPESLYKRLKLNVELSDELDIDIYSFPMKYNPIHGEFSKNREYLGIHWNRKFIRTIQSILNSTKGKIGKSKSFFYEAFGENEDAFNKLLWMPEEFIINRFYFKENGLTEEWWNQFNSLTPLDLLLAKTIISKNDFETINMSAVSSKLENLISYYKIERYNDELTPKRKLIV